MGELLFRPGPIVWVQELFGPGHEKIFRVLTQAGTTWGVVFVVGLALWLWGRRDAYAVVGILVLEAMVSFGLNQVLGVARPDAPGVIKYERVQVGSFPSGHVFLVTVLWGSLYARRRVPAWLVALLVSTVAVARLYLGVHYLADVVAGALLGLLLVRAYLPLWRWAEPRVARWTTGAWAWVCVAMVGATAAAWALGFLGDNPFKWHSAGLVLAGGPALLLEHRSLHHIHERLGARSRPIAVGLALLLLVPLAVLDRSAGESPYLLGAALIAAGVVWAWLLLPAVLTRLDSAREPTS